MREIKFRAWFKKESRMIEPVIGLNLKSNNQTISWFEDMHDALSGCETDTFLDQVEIMQFTGLYDDLDNEIYEGDIIRIHNGEYEVKWEKYQFILVDFYSSSNDTPSDYFSERSGETVIGNIYENPELLEVST